MVEVTLARGRPDKVTENEQDGTTDYSYERDHGERLETQVRFARDDSGENAVIMVCTYSNWTKVFGLGNQSTEDKVISKLGDPEVVSISADGLRKAISYPSLNVAFVLEKSRVRMTCVKDVALTFRDPYKDSEQ